MACLSRRLAATLAAGAALLLEATAVRADFTFVHVTDTHVTTSEADKSPAANVAARFREISALSPAPAFVVDTGDVCEVGTDAEYAVFRKIRDANLTVPLRLAPGNHDVRWNPRGKEGYTRGSGQPLYQSWDKENVHFVLLDSTVLLQHWGHFDQAELDWLARDLAKIGPERPVIIGFHHWVGRESIQVDNESALLQVLAPYNVRLFLIGHGHSDIQWSINGTPAIMAKGLYQGSYHLIHVTRDRLEVLRRTEANQAPTQVVLSEPLQRPPGFARRATITVAGGQATVVLERLLNSGLPASASVACRVDEGKSLPMATSATGWSGTFPVAGIVSGAHRVTITATTAEGRAYQTPVTLELKPSSGITPSWHVNVGGAVQGKIVYSGGVLYVPSMGGDLVALDAATGKEKWRTHTDGAIFSTPLVTENRVYFGSADHQVYAADRKTGKVVWKYRTDGAVFAGASIAQGIVCLGSTDQKIYGLNAESGKFVWSAQASGMFQSQSATDGERFFVGGWDNEFRCLDARTGKPLWNQRFGKQFYYAPAIATPAVADGMAFVSSNDGHLHAMDSVTGAIRWEINGPALGYSSPLWSEGQVYNASLTDNGRVFCFDGKTGAKRWESPTGSVIYDSSCARGGDALYVGCVNGTLSSLSLSDGTVRWQYHLAPGHLLSSPATDENSVYIGSLSGEVYALPLRALGPVTP